MRLTWFQFCAANYKSFNPAAIGLVLELLLCFKSILAKLHCYVDYLSQTLEPMQGLYMWLYYVYWYV